MYLEAHYKCSPGCLLLEWKDGFIQELQKTLKLLLLLWIRANANNQLQYLS